jgi:hypothetical protein
MTAWRLKIPLGAAGRRGKQPKSITGLIRTATVSVAAASVVVKKFILR